MFFFVFFIILLNCSITNTKDIAYITNQESNMLDVIDLKAMKKIDELKVGMKPAGILVDQKSQRIFVANPESNNVSILNLAIKSNKIVNSGNSPMGLALDKKFNILFVSNWYDNTITVIDLNSERIQKKIKVGKSPAGIYLDENLNKLFVANREDNNISVIDTKTFKSIKKVQVGKAPFGIYSENYLDYVVVTNVQSNSISIIDKEKLEVYKNFNVSDWPYSVIHNKNNNQLYVTNQRDDSISVIDMNKKKRISTLSNICEYPEGIDISYSENLIVVACWFQDNIILIDLDSFKIKKKIETSGGPRAFGRFILKKEYD